MEIGEKCMTVEELIDFLQEQPSGANAKVCMEGDNIMCESSLLVDAMYIFSTKADEEEIILIYG